MITWEYNLFSYNLAEFINDEDVMIETLDRLGKSGWELTSVIHMNREVSDTRYSERHGDHTIPPNCLIFFKRPKIDTE